MTLALLAFALVMILICIPHAINCFRGQKCELEQDMLVAFFALMLGVIPYIVLIGLYCFSNKEQA